MHWFRAAICLALVVTLTACLKPYRIEVQQGNLVTEKEVLRLKRGMTMREVRYVMGTPLVVDPFHADRWDYVYSIRKGRANEPERRRVTLLFDGDRLDRITGDVVAQLDPVATVQVASESGGTVVTEPREKKKRSIFKRAWQKVWGAGKDRDDEF